MRNRRSQAFTLIEIMIVIAIIGILAGIMVPNFMRARGEAKLATCQQNLLTIAKAIELANIRHPEIVENKGCELGTIYYVDSQCPLVTEGFLSAPLKCPGDDRYYLIEHEYDGGYSIQHGSTYKAHKDLGIGGFYPIYYTGYGIVNNVEEFHKYHGI